MPRQSEQGEISHTLSHYLLSLLEYGSNIATRKFCRGVRIEQLAFRS